MSDIKTGFDMWDDYKNHYGVITARILCLRYLDMQTNKKDPEEQAFCRELREAMAMDRSISDRAVYHKSWEEAQRDGEAELFNDSDMANRWCAGEINDAIKACQYGDGSHKLEHAVRALIDHCGTERLSYVLALDVRRHRDEFSDANRDWSDGFDIQSGFAGSVIMTRTEVLDEFITCVRETLDRISEAEMQIYADGADFWNNLKEVSAGIDAALDAGGKYIGAKAKIDCTSHEIRFCRELFTAMYKDTAVMADPSKLIYPYTYEEAAERGEISLYSGSQRQNTLCAAAIDNAIQDACYRPYFFHGDLAAMKVIHEYGFDRVNMVLARNLQALTEGWESKNHKWARDIVVPEGLSGGAFGGAIIKSKQSYLSYFATSVRKLSAFINADRSAIPKHQENAGVTPHTAEKSQINESEQNFAAWINVTESSRYHWVEDEIYRLNGRGAMYYTGGEDGVYMRISKDGKLEAGNYEGAVPHIGEAMFTISVNKQFDSFNEAFKAAMEAGGKRFMVDMFSGESVSQPLFATKRGEPEEKPSVLQKIRDAQKAPQQPRKPKEPGQRKNKNDVDL